MTPSTRFAVIVGAVSATLVATSIVAGREVFRWVKRWRSKSPEEVEKLRRLAINRGGRITSGEVVDFIEEAEKKSRVLVYRYEVAGVTYEAAQEISGFAEFPVSGVAGLTSSVKYDPQKPMNSIIACEEWNGLMRVNDTEAAKG